jgi:hypothetical protein
MAPPVVRPESEIDVRSGSVIVVAMVAIVATVAVMVVETAQAGAAAISTITVVEVVVRVFALNTGPDRHLGVYTDVSVINMVVDVVVLVLNYRLINDIAADQGPRRMMWVSIGAVKRSESGVTVAR